MHPKAIYKMSIYRTILETWHMHMYAQEREIEQLIFCSYRQDYCGTLIAKKNRMQIKILQT